MRIKDDTLKLRLLELAKDIANESGVEAINLRTLAKRAGVAVGTVYNYFSGKDDILLALTEDYWRDTLIQMQSTVSSQGFSNQLCEIYEFLQSRIQGQASGLMGSLSNVQLAGRAKMGLMQSVLCKKLTELISLDELIKDSAFDEGFSKEDFSKLVVINLMAHLRIGAEEINIFAKAVEKIIY